MKKETSDVRAREKERRESRYAKNNRNMRERDLLSEDFEQVALATSFV